MVDVSYTHEKCDWHMKASYLREFWNFGHNLELGLGFQASSTSLDVQKHYK